MLNFVKSRTAGKKYITRIVISAVLLFLSSCIFFQNINQPSKSAPNEIVAVTIIATTEGGSEEPYFGVCLPIGWTIPGDSVQCGGAYEEIIYYDTSVTFNQESVSPAPNGYYWWAGKGIPDETAVGTVFANLKIQTDNQQGVFSIDYMLGDSYNGVNYERSNGHLIEITTDPLILYINPEEGYQNLTLDMNILGLNTHFSDGTGTDNVWLSNNSDEIYANNFVVNSNTSIDANFTIPLAADTGLCDINVETDIDGIITKAVCFNILPSPPIIVVSPDSIVVGVLPGTTRTKTITIGNEGEDDLYFDIVGGFSPTNYALKFDGIDDYLSILDDSSLHLTNVFTIEAWGNFNSLPSGQFDHVPVVWRGSDIIGNNYHFRIAQGNGTNMITWGSGGQNGTEYFFNAGTIETNNWYHFAYVVNEENMFGYLNGELVEDRTCTPPYLVQGYNTFLGKANRAGVDVYSDGMFDEVRIWGIAKNQLQIQSEMYKELTGTELGLVAYWKFDEGMGSNIHDKTINGNNGTLYGDVQWINSSIPFELGWFLVNQDSGMCVPHSYMDIELFFDATEIDTGDYYASIIVKSNDPFTPSVTLPIHMIVSSSVGLEDGLNMPLTFNLYQNFPNPFNPSTTIQYSIKEGSSVELILYDILGRQVEVLVNEEQDAGQYKISLDAGGLASGIYLYKLKAGSFVETKKMILLK